MADVTREALRLETIKLCASLHAPSRDHVAIMKTADVLWAWCEGSTTPERPLSKTQQNVAKGIARLERESKASNSSG